MNPPSAIENLKIQWEIHFLTFFNTDRNTPQKKFRTVIIQDFMRKLLSKMILDLGKCPKQKTCTFTFMRFLVGALPEVQNHFRKQFSHKVLYNYSSKFFLWSVSVSILKSQKNGFPIVFSNLQLTRGDSFIRDRPLYIQSFSNTISTKATGSKLNSLLKILHYHPTLKVMPVRDIIRRKNKLKCKHYSNPKVLQSSTS